MNNEIFFKCSDGTLINPEIVSAVFKVYDNGFWFVVFILPVGTKIRVKYENITLAKNEIERFKEFSEGLNKPKENVDWNRLHQTIPEILKFKDEVEVEYGNGERDFGQVDEFRWVHNLDSEYNIVKWRKVK